MFLFRVYLHLLEYLHLFDPLDVIRGLFCDRLKQNDAKGWLQSNVYKYTHTYIYTYYD